MDGPLEVCKPMPQERDDDLDRFLEAPEYVGLG